MKEIIFVTSNKGKIATAQNDLGMILNVTTELRKIHALKSLVYGTNEVDII